MATMLRPQALGFGVLAVVFAVSLWSVLRTDTTGQGASNQRIVRVAHWQLEPGFREALDAVIADYNALPHVRARNYRVEQIAVSERVYNQFMNVHLLSGTAPDLSALGMTTLGTDRAQNYTPYLQVLQRPNPYNTEESLPQQMAPSVRAHLRTAPWRETFINGLQSSQDPTSGQYFGVQIATWGSLRLYYNDSLLRRIKAMIRYALESEIQPEWLQALLAGQGEQLPIVADRPALRQWLEDPQPPQSLGQLLLLCEAAGAYGQLLGEEKLVAIAGSRYARDVFDATYNAAFFHPWEARLDLDQNGSITTTEALMAYAQGRWDFNADRVRAYYALQRTLASYFPTGFLGIDREQANRRFITGNALFLASGAWDASSLRRAIAAHSDPTARFGLGVATFPIAGEGERWSQYALKPRSETQSMRGVALALYKHSPHKAEAIDFLQYLTSYGPHSKFIREAGWLPSVIGVEPNAALRGFVPELRGVSDSLRLDFTASAGLQTQYNGHYLLYLAGEIDYATFAERVAAVLRNPRTGIERQWLEAERRERERTRALERSLGLQRFHQLRGVETVDGKDPRYTQLLTRSIEGLSGLRTQYTWQLLDPQTPFPTVD